MDLLLDNGALDVFYTSIYMKKNRPAYKLSIICKSSNTDKISEIIFSQTSTIGVRMYPVSRICMDRYFKKIETPYGEISVKVAKFNNIRKFYPEYEDCKKVALENNIPLIEVYNAIHNK